MSDLQYFPKLSHAAVITFYGREKSLLKKKALQWLKGNKRFKPMLCYTYIALYLAWLLFDSQQNVRKKIQMKCALQKALVMFLIS